MTVPVVVLPPERYTQEIRTAHCKRRVVAGIVDDGCMGSPTLPTPLHDPIGSPQEHTWRQLERSGDGYRGTAADGATTPLRSPVDLRDRAAANLQAVLATARAITANLDLSQTLGTLADHLEWLIPNDGLYIGLLDHEAGVIRPLFTRFREMKANADETIPIGKGIVSRAIAHGQVTIVNNAQQDPDAHYPVEAGPPPVPEHLLVVPLIIGQRTLGALMLRRLRNRRFSDDDLEIASVLGEQAAVALHAALLFEEERHQHKVAATLGEIAAALNSAVTLEELAQRLGTAAVKAVDVQCCSLHIYDEPAESTVASFYIGVSGSEERRMALSHVPPKAMPVERRLLETGQPVSGTTLLELLDELPEEDRLGMRGGAVIPLRVQGRAQGAMYVWTPVPSGSETALPYPCFDANDLMLLETIGDQAGVAIERARLYATSEQHRRELQALADVNGIIAGSLDIHTIVLRALERMHKMIPFDVAWIALWDDEPGVLRVTEVWGKHSSHMKHVELPLNDSVNGAVFLSGRRKAGEIGDNVADIDRQKMVGGGRYYLCLPLAVESRLLGTMYLSREESEAFSAAETTLADILVGQVAIGIERSRGFSIALAERQRSVRQAQNLRTVLKSSQRLALQSDIASTLTAFTAGIAELIPDAASCIGEVDFHSREIRLLHKREAPDVQFAATSLPFGSGVSGRVAEDRQPQRINHLERRPEYNATVFGPKTQVLAQLHGLHLMSVPLTVEGALIGICVVTRVGGEPFTDDEFSSLQVFAGHAAAALRNADLLVRNRDLYLGGIRALVSAVDAKDAYTRGHSERVSHVSRRIAEELGLALDLTETIELAGLLHDIGKIGVPDAILKKPDQLDEAESAVMMTHATLGAAILARSGSEGLASLVPLVRHHHEWVNGGGYPDSLTTDDIPVGSAIIAVADAFDTLVTDRPYRRRRSLSDAIEDLREATGSQFRADVVDALAMLVERDPAFASQDELTPLFDSPGELMENRGRASWTGLPAAGQMGDARPLGLLVELASMTSNIPDLPAFLEGVTRMIQRRLGYQDVRMLLADPALKMLSVAAHSSAIGPLPIGTTIPSDVPIYAEVLLDREPRLTTHRVADNGDGDDWGARARSELVIPLVVDAAPIGLIDVASTRPDAFSANDIALLTAIGGQIAAAVHVAQLHDTTKRAAMTDGLTNLANHRAFYLALDEALTCGNPFTVMILDVEGLKRVNDTSGHLAGDAFLRRVATIIRETVRPSDVVARYGGDEFAVILPEMSRRKAAGLAGSIRSHLSLDPLNHYGSSIRFGIASAPVDGTTAVDLVACADRRLYEMRAREISRSSSVLLHTANTYRFGS